MVLIPKSPLLVHLRQMMKLFKGLYSDKDSNELDFLSLKNLSQHSDLLSVYTLMIKQGRFYFSPLFPSHLLPLPPPYSGNAMMT